MKTLKNEIGQSKKSRALGLGLAAVLLATGLALADQGGGYRRTVVVQPHPAVVVRQPDHRPREVTIVHQEPRREVKVVRYVGHGRGRRQVIEMRREVRDGHGVWYEENGNRGFRHGDERSVHQDYRYGRERDDSFRK